MEQKAFPAFGHVVIRNQIAAGEIINDDIYLNGVVKVEVPFETCWFYTKGTVHQVNVDTGDVSVRGPGYCNAVTKEVAGTWRAEFIEDATVFCVPPSERHPMAAPLIDSLSVFQLSQGQSTVLLKGTKLALCQGRISVNGREIPQLRQIEVKSSDQTVTAVEDCYGLIFP